MKKGLWIIGVGILFAASCNHSPKTEQSSELANGDTLKADSSLVTSSPSSGETKEVPDRKEKVAACKAFLEQFYKGLDDNGLDNNYVKKYITPKAAQFLKDNYDYDCMDGNCLAAWLFEYDTTADVGTLKERTIEEIDENTYKVTHHYVGTAEGDYLYAVQLGLVQEGDSYKIDTIKTVLNQFPNSQEKP